MATLEKEGVREARNQDLGDRMPRVLEASRRLQSALEICGEDPWPAPFVPVQIHKELVVSNTLHLRNSLRTCELFAVDMDRETEKLDFLDDHILLYYKDELETKTAKQEQSVAEPEEADCSTKCFEGKSYTYIGLNTPDAVMRDAEDETISKIDGTNWEVVSGHTSPEALDTWEASNQDISSMGNQHKETLCKEIRDKCEPEGRRRVAFDQKRIALPQSAIPDRPMPGTFTNAICHQKDFRPVPILALTMIDSTSALDAVTAGRNVLLSHLEVGLDAVEALCQGRVTFDESTYWRRNVWEAWIGKLGMVKADGGEYSETLEQVLLKEGMGLGEWLWFGIKYQQSRKERKKGKEGKWACFGVPIDAARQGVWELGTAMYGGGVDVEGNRVAKYKAKVKRLTYSLSIGGIACMDLWEGAEQWQQGAWEEIKAAIAHNRLLVRIVVPCDEMMDLAQKRAGAEKMEVEVEGERKRKERA